MTIISGRHALTLTRPVRVGTLVLISSLLGSATSLAAGPQAEWGGLTNAAQIRALSPDQARQRIPVRLCGVVTFFNATSYLHFIQDETAGIYLRGSGNQPELKAGQRVMVEGTTGAGEYAPVVVPHRVEILGETNLPAAPAVTAERLASGQQDSQFVAVTGIVRTVGFEEKFRSYRVEIAMGGVRLPVYVQSLPVTNADQLIGAIVEAQGVCSSVFNRQRQLFNLRLLVPPPLTLQIQSPILEDPFDRPVTSIHGLLEFTPQGEYGRPTKVKGSVVHHQPGVALWIQDGAEGLRIRTRATRTTQVGDIVEVLGFPTMGAYSPEMEDALFRVLAPGPRVEPAVVNHDQALRGDFDSRLIRINQARLIDRSRTGREQFLVLAEGDFIFYAYLEEASSNDAFAHLKNDSLVQATGVCLVEPGEWRVSENWRAQSFRLLLRSANDVKIIQAPPWWTLEKVLGVAGLLAVCALAAIIWVGALRRRVHKQTKIIEGKLQAEAALKRRYENLFENANDMVFTHDLAGRFTSINRAGERLLQRGRDRLLGLNLVDLVAEDQREAARQLLAQVVQGAEPPAAEWDFLNAAGHRVKLEISSRVIEAAGKPLEVEGVARDITERRRLERELLEISNREQRRIGHDLHDGVCQQLAAIAYRLDILGDQLAAKGATEAREAEKIGTLISEATAQARSVARGLFPVRLDENGLVSALEELAAASSQRFRTICHFHPPAQPLTVDSEAALHLYYIAQEAILNAVRHGHPARVELTLQNDVQQVRLVVRDNGTGFQPGSPRSGMGIRIMRYRAKVIGATLDVHSRPGDGTEVVCTFVHAQL